MGNEPTTIHLDRDVRDALSDAKSFPSMSYNDLLRDMLDQYDPPKAAAEGQ